MKELYYVTSTGFFPTIPIIKLGQRIQPGWYRCYTDYDQPFAYVVRYVTEDQQTYYCNPDDFVRRVRDDGTYPNSSDIYDSNISGFWKIEQIG